MKFSVLDKKETVDGKIDLLSNFLKIDFDKVIIDEWILIDEQSAMLLDLISFAMYGTEDYCDLLKKFNKIDNPLELYIGQIIAIPNLPSIEANSQIITTNSKFSTITKTRNSFTSNKKITTPSKKPIPSSNFIKNSNGNLIF